jgi:hypothetical protein
MNEPIISQVLYDLNLKLAPYRAEFCECEVKPDPIVGQTLVVSCRLGDEHGSELKNFVTYVLCLKCKKVRNIEVSQQPSYSQVY